MRRKIIGAGLISLLIAGCAGTPDRYQDQFVRKDAQYVNRDIGFSMNFDPTWKVYPHTASMPPGIKEAAETFREEGAELLFFAASSEDKIIFARAIVEDTNLPVREYFKLVKEVNSDELRHVAVQTKQTPQGEIIEWVYTVNDDQITFKEYQMRKGEYNIRIGFWTLTSLFKDYHPDFQHIAGTLNLQLAAAKQSP